MNATLETIAQFLTTKYPSLILASVIGIFIWSSNLMNSRVERIKNTELPEIRNDLHDLHLNFVRIDVKVDHLEEEMKEMKADIKEMKTDIQDMKLGIIEMRADIKTLLKKTP